MRQRKCQHHRRFSIITEFQGYHGWWPWHIRVRFFDSRHRPRTLQLRTLLTATFKLKP